MKQVILRAMAKRITWWQAAEIIEISEWQMRRWLAGTHGYNELTFALKLS